MKAVVTGAADGIGKALTLKLLSEGASVLAVDINAEGLAALELSEKDHPELAIFTEDVSSDQAALRICEEAKKRLGKMDFLVNNAGVTASPGNTVDNHKDDEWDRVININLNAVFRLCRQAIPLLRQSQRGRIVNIGSIMSTLGGVGMAAYSASKHAVAGLSKSLALELGADGVTVNYIQPGAIVTGITRPAMESNSGFTEFWTEKSALKRMGQPEDIANGISFLLSEDAGFITGHGLLIDGGVLQSA